MTKGWFFPESLPAFVLAIAVALNLAAGQAPQRQKSEPAKTFLAVVLTPDGRRAASVKGGERDLQLELWDVKTGAKLRSFNLPKSCLLAAFSANSRLLVTGNCDDPELPLVDTLKLWEVETGRELGILASESKLTALAVAFSADGRLVASASQFGWIAIFDAKTRREVQQIVHHFGEWLWAVAFSPDGRLLASAGKDEMVKLWETASWREARVLQGHTGVVHAVAFSPDGRLLASGSADNTVRLWEVNSGRELRSLPVHIGSFETVAFSSDGRWLASVGAPMMKVWEVASGREVGNLPAGPLMAVAFTPDGRLVIGSSQGKLALWRPMAER